jgi:transposase
VAQRLGIELLYLPAYSPNLNLIERLWKFIKKNCLYNRYYSDFTAFRQAITSFLRTVPQRHREELDRLLMLRFQTFQDQQFRWAA